MDSPTKNKDFNVNFSCYDFPFTIWEMLPLSEIMIKAGTIVPVAIFGIIGNCLLLFTILGNKSLSKSPTNFLISNMALSDLCLLLLSPGLFLFREIFQSYKLGVVGCKIEGMFEVWLLITSVITLCFVSYERLTAIAFPMQARLNFHQTKIVIFSSWICGMILSSPLAIFRHYQERKWKNFLEAFCTEDLNILPLYWHILIVALVWIPLAVLIFCYTTIFVKLDQYEKIKKKRDHPLTISYKRRFAVTLFIVVVTFVVFRIPFTTVVFMRSKMLQHTAEVNQIEGSFQIMWYISRYLIFLNCALTPCIYGVTNENYRRAFRHTKIYKYFCFCTPIRTSTSMVIFTVEPTGRQLQSKLEPRTATVSDNKRLKTEKRSKFTTFKKSCSFKNCEKFQSMNTFI